MSTRSTAVTVLGVSAGVVVAVVGLAVAQPPAAKSQPPRPSTGRAVVPPAAKAPTAPPAPAGTAPKSSASTAGAAAKAEILNSYRWRRAMFEMNEWLSAQQIYTPQEVAKIKADFAAKVEKMSAADLQVMLDDMDAKFQILDTKQAQDARAWLAQYLSILSDKKREELIRKIPNIATMTAAQLRQQIARIEERRQAQAQQQATVQQLRESATNPWNQTSLASQQAYVRDHTMSRSAYSSPYRAPSNERPFENVRTGPSTEFYVTPYGGVGLIFGNGF